MKPPDLGLKFFYRQMNNHPLNSTEPLPCRTAAQISIAMYFLTDRLTDKVM